MKWGEIVIVLCDEYLCVDILFEVFVVLCLILGLKDFEVIVIVGNLSG